MTDREKFEEWVSGMGQPFGLNFRFGKYFEADTNAAWLAWQASRKQALEEMGQAAKKLGLTLVLTVNGLHLMRLGEIKAGDAS